MDQTNSSELYRIAYQCEENKRNGCLGNCGECPFNVALYTQSINDASLLKATAMIDNTKWHQRQAVYDAQALTKGIMSLLFVIGMCVFFWTCTHPKPKVKVVEQPSVQTYQYYTGSPADDPGNFRVNRPGGVTAPMAFSGAVDIALWANKNIRDITGDGIVNCQDYAMMFFCLVGDTNICRVIINENPSTGMNHLFVKYKGVMIEPSSGYPMTQVWGNKYDPAYDKDQTTYWYWTRLRLY